MLKKGQKILYFQKIFLPLHRLNQSIDFLNLSQKTHYLG